MDSWSGGDRKSSIFGDLDLSHVLLFDDTHGDVGLLGDSQLGSLELEEMLPILTLDNQQQQQQQQVDPIGSGAKKGNIKRESTKRSRGGGGGGDGDGDDDDDNHNLQQQQQQQEPRSNRRLLVLPNELAQNGSKPLPQHLKLCLCDTLPHTRHRHQLPKYECKIARRKRTLRIRQRLTRSLCFCVCLRAVKKKEENMKPPSPPPPPPKHILPLDMHLAMHWPPHCLANAWHC